MFLQNVQMLLLTPTDMFSNTEILHQNYKLDERLYIGLYLLSTLAHSTKYFKNFSFKDCGFFFIPPSSRLKSFTVDGALHAMPWPVFGLTQGAAVALFAAERAIKLTH